MDGNGRWRDAPSSALAGHRAGIASVRDVVEASARLGLEAITLYAFSKDNWKRSRAEVDTLMALLREYLRRELETLQKNRIRFRVIGAIEELVAPVREELERGMTATAGNDGLLFNIALSYGGRAEIVEAPSCVLTGPRQAGSIPSLDENFRAFPHAGVPDPDLLIRTAASCA